jgi:hypothetical protein
MFKKIMVIGLLGIAGLWLISMIPKNIGRAMSEFLIIGGIVAFLLAVLMFGFKKIPAKLWWE